jgi:hypothetical protein
LGILTTGKCFLKMANGSTGFGPTAAVIFSLNYYLKNSYAS